jgi:uncharacterized membrane protein HdeD (DUF308 family)
MSEPARPADMFPCGGWRWGWEPACGTITLLAVIAVLAWLGETLPVAAVLRGIQLIAAGPFKFAPAFRLCSIGHLAVHPISQS